MLWRLILLDGLDDEPAPWEDGAAGVSVVAVADEPHEWACGVRCVELERGEALGFDFGRRVKPAWHMAGVSYPLTLVSLTDDGAEVGRLTMEPCSAHERDCPRYSLLPSRWFVEVRDP